MDKIDYNQAGGFPLSTQILDAAQQAYKNFNTFGNLAGELAIIDGCNNASGGTVTNGFVSIYGELLPFLGTTITDNVVIVEVPDARGFESGDIKAVIYTRYATFGDATVSYPWEDFRRPLTLFALEDRLIQLEKAVPIGLVAVWGKPAEEIPEGWEIHIPFQGTVPVGRKTGDTNFGAALGTQIGTAQVTLTQNQLPKTEGTFQTIAGNSDTPTGITTYTDNSSATIAGSTSAFGHRHVKISFGNDQSHSNIQPSTIVDFIIFVGFE
ncbi:hypothetical protein SAMN05421847_2197 [Halpernia humi]|uniref:Uncharacterized protein n=1 Tax=Halpernia humi TaxID=493375 RepID=A0A1H5ZT31_9FLAO|nr:hypothetical protein [Halpernia humi]SEG39638.1 hypothetical protein SAMN05421847_2197 [Halpernia humi]